MEELLLRYRELIRHLDAEAEKIDVCLGEELSEVYCKLLQKERRELEENLRVLENYIG